MDLYPLVGRGRAADSHSVILRVSAPDNFQPLVG
jgi:hypothetical protein